jgi:hypothetical protein
VTATALMAGATMWWSVSSDDYLVPFVPMSILFTLDVLRRARLSAALLVAGFGATVGYSVTSERDYLAWHGAAWEASEELTAQGIPPQDIDGGFEWRGWHTFEQGLAALDPVSRLSDVWAWTRTPRFQVAFSANKDWHVVEAKDYRAPFASRRLVILRRPPMQVSELGLDLQPGSQTTPAAGAIDTAPPAQVRLIPGERIEVGGWLEASRPGALVVITCGPIDRVTATALATQDPSNGNVRWRAEFAVPFQREPSIVRAWLLDRSSQQLRLLGGEPVLNTRVMRH